MPDVQNISLPKIIKHLALIKNLIALEKEDEIYGHVAKLEQLGITPVTFVSKNNCRFINWQDGVRRWLTLRQRRAQRGVS